MTVASDAAGFGRAFRAGEYDFWVLDLDGTLVDVETSYARSVMHRVGDRLGHGFTNRDAEVLWYGFGDARRVVLDQHGIDRDQFWRMFHEVEDPASRAEATFLYDDAAVVGELDEPVALLTHCQESLTRPVLARHDIADWFDAVVCCTDETGWKPDPEPVQRALNGLDIGRDETGALVGDNPEDVGAAWNTGLAGVHVTRHDPARSERCVLGDHRIDSLDLLAE